MSEMKEELVRAAGILEIPLTPEQLEQCMNLKALTLPGHMAEYRKM